MKILNLLATFLGSSLLFVSASYADLVALWDFDGATGLEMTTGAGYSGIWTGLKTATLYGDDVTRVTDSQLGSQVWQFAANGTSKGYLSLGTIPVIDTTAATDFTFSFWAKSYSTGTEVIAGNRNGGGDSNGKYSFFKLKSQGAEYQNTRNGGGSFNQTYPNDAKADGIWRFYTVTKAGDQLTVYLNSKQIAATTISGTLNATDAASGGMGWKLGGNGINSENWKGSMDDFAFRNNALSAAEVKTVHTQLSTYTDRENAVRATLKASDTLVDFNVPSQALAKGSSVTLNGTGWNVIEYGLENKGAYATGINASISNVSDYGTNNGILKITGTYDNHSGHWGGATLKSAQTYTATAENPIIFSVDRLYLEQTERAARSSIWLWGSDSKYLHFSQNTEGVSNGKYSWSYNNSNTSTGTGTGFYDDLGAHKMAIKYDGAKAWFYVDGKLTGCTEISLSSFNLMVTGQSWGTENGTSDPYRNGSINTAFDSLVIGRPGVAINPVITHGDSFATGISANWTLSNPSAISTSIGTIQTGIMGIQNSNEAIWNENYSKDGLKLSIVRDSMNSTVAGSESGIRLTSGTEWLTIAQDSTGMWDVKSSAGITLTGTTSDIYEDDFLMTTIALTSSAKADGTTDFSLSLDGNAPISFSATGLSDGLLASLYSYGQNAYVGFASFGIDGKAVPEPSTWALFLLGLGFLGWLKKRA